jgi:glucosamine--fructose-6-phosphate aminotransferase (isomerizing)
MSIAALGINTKQEILSQPEVWGKTLYHLQDLRPTIYPNVSDYDQVIFSGCGSTYYLSLWAARVCEKDTGVISRAVPSSDLLLFPDTWLQKNKKTLFVAVSRSAETTETILALKSFKAGGYGDTVVVTCYPNRELAQLSPNVIDVPEAKEESIAQTRSFSNMLMAVSWLISKNIPNGLPTLYSKAGKDLIERFSSVATRLGRDQKMTKFFFLGSGSLYGLANEAMLKMKEMSLTYSESFHTLEFRHGPMAMVDNESQIVSLISESAKDHEYRLLREMRLKGARILGFLEKDDPAASGAFDDLVLFSSGITEPWRAPLYLPILQLIAYERAISKGLNPDQPANLTSAVVLHD